MVNRGSESSSYKFILAFSLIGMLLGTGLWTFRYELFVANQSYPQLPPPTFVQLNAVVTRSAEENFASYPKLQIPALGIDSVIVSVVLQSDGWDVRVLGNRVGHLAYTNWVGERGNIALAGHSEMTDGSEGIFARLETLRSGDEIKIVDRDTVYVYLVSEIKIVEASDLSVVYSTNDDRLTLITCTDYNFISDDYGERIVVVAHRKRR